MPGIRKGLNLSLLAFGGSVKYFPVSEALSAALAGGFRGAGCALLLRVGVSAAGSPS